MAWGVEKMVPLASGIVRLGSEVAKKIFNYLQSLIVGGGALVGTCRCRSLPGNELGAGKLDPLHPRSRVQQQSPDPAATRSHAGYSGR